ncbi:MAG TPA: orotidine-5'-phosphate decarboxylase [Isosphaeraceae bacterium]|nr:orotidine-5'-phosphate decarboxylase [Isosphaeraceae bacterium]
MSDGHFADRLAEQIRRKGTAAMVGIDPRPEGLPKEVAGRFGGDREGLAGAVGAFGREVIDVVATRVPAVKLQAAFYEALGPEGMAELHETARYARRRGLIVVIDGKRNDIGTTAEAYARAYLGGEAAWDADALTVNPYLGSDGIDPFVKAAAAAGNGLFVLVRTSNPSAGDFQDLEADGKPLYQHVADRLADWAAPHRGESGYSFMGAVVGATYPGQLAALRAALPGVVFLVPGYGAQGGKAADVAAAFDEDGLGAVVNSSRGVTSAFERPDLKSLDWRRAIEAAVVEMIDDLAAHTPAGRLRAGGGR